MLEQFLSRQFLAFVFVGASAALLHWLVRILLSQYFSYTWAVCWAYVVGMTAAFFLNRIYVFPTSDRAVANQARDFVVINMAFFPVVWAAALMLNWLLLELGLEHYSEEIAHAAAISLPVFATFLLYKFYAFGRNNHE